MKKTDISFWQKGFKGIAHGGFHISPGHLFRFMDLCEAKGIQVVGIRSHPVANTLECILLENEAYLAFFGDHREESWYLLS
ncbi:hypothetical protein [Chitinophaga qingshengii]|uniref:Uncharacterized protein n=1 Tax=Chitinophaga qingshengii TaxID=1569794 RepID=A0ABR7TYH6_9BACT|nr:hypothetical protein [Chitinophaga qingshengii]MBC9934855.1 hypothetical protein [Chitinophaga qingshengii]